MSNFNRPVNFNRDIVTDYDKNNVDKLSYVNEKERLLKNKFKSDDYDFTEVKTPINPLFVPNALITNQLNYNAINQINPKEYDPLLHYLNEKGLYDKNTKVRYYVDYVNIDSANRSTIPRNIIAQTIKSSPNALSIIKNSLNIKVGSDQINLFNQGDKITIQNLDPTIVKYKAFPSASPTNTILVFTLNKNYVTIKINPNCNQDPSDPSGNYTNYVGVDTKDVKVIISGMIGVTTLGPDTYNDEASAYIGNIPVSFLNSEHQIYITPPSEPSILPQLNTFYILMPYTSDGTNIASINNYIITFTFNHYNFIPINQINANYPVNSTQLNGYQLIESVDNINNILTIKIYPPLDLNLPQNQNYQYINFGNSINIGFIKNTITGYPDQNSYNIELNKLFTNVILVRLIDSVFPNPNKTLFNTGKKKNNRIYFQSVENIKDIQYIEIQEGLYDIPKLKLEIENAFTQLSRNITNSIFNYDLNYNIIFDADINTNLVTFNSYKTKILQVPIVSVNPIINPADPSIGVGTYTITIKHDNHGITTPTLDILFTGFISHLGLKEENLNGLQNVTIIDKDRYQFTLTNINLDPIKVSTNGGRNVNVRVPSRIKFYFNYEDTMGEVLGFRNVGESTSITDFQYVISNADLYLNEPTLNVNGKNIIIKQNKINLKKFNYFFIKCKELPIITNTNKVTDILAKIIINDNDLLIDTFSITPSFYYDPIKDLSHLNLKFYYPDGDLVDFDGLDHNFILEITTFDNIPELTNITTNITIDK
jgi:hypothetical protein